MLVLKGNHRALHAAAGQLLEDPRHVIADRHSTADGDHGSIETRTSMVSSEIEGLQNRHRWPGLAAVGRVIRTRETAARATTESAYYLLSATLSPSASAEWSALIGASRTAYTGFSTSS